jgi:deoxyadenosine/deoxycytidine kinase
MNRYPVVVVEGLIGSGKSTLTEELGKELGKTTLILKEPDDKNNANPYLPDYYKDPNRWSLIMQIHLLSMRYRMHLHAQWHAMQGWGCALLDRSFYGDTAFARVQRSMELMSEREFETYQILYHALTATVLHPTVCVRILVSPDVCSKRIIKRLESRYGRNCEIAIDIDYLKALDKEIDHMISVLRHSGVIILDVPYDADRDSEEQRKQTVSSLADRILSIEPPDFFLDLHRRTL